jgi:hypothetical protein
MHYTLPLSNWVREAPCAEFPEADDISNKLMPMKVAVATSL